MNITMEEIRKIIDDETIADSGIVLQTTTAARKVLELIEQRLTPVVADICSHSDWCAILKNGDTCSPECVEHPLRR